MNITKLSVVVLLASMLLSVGAKPALAKENERGSSHQTEQKDKDKDKDKDKHHDDHDDDDDHEGKEHHDSGKEKSTYVTGVVSDSHSAVVTNGTVTVKCNGHTEVSPINGSGKYFVTFSWAECKPSDTATATANTDKGSGSGSANIHATPDPAHAVILNISVMDIAVPEFGMVGGAVSGVGSLVGYLLMKSRLKV